MLSPPPKNTNIHGKKGGKKEKKEKKEKEGSNEGRKENKKGRRKNKVFDYGTSILLDAIAV